MEINGVFEGGCVRGIALAGAAAATLDQGYRFHRAVGTSARALVAAPVVAGCDSGELEEEVAGLNWLRLLHPTPMASLPLLGKLVSLIVNKGVNATTRIEAVWSRLLLRKGIRTFADLPHGSLQVVATDLTHGAGVAFPHCLPGYGIDPSTLSVARAPSCLRQCPSCSLRWHSVTP